MHEKVKVLLSRLVGVEAVADGYFDKEDVTADSLVQKIESKVGELVKPTIESTLKSKFDADLEAKITEVKNGAKADYLKSFAEELKAEFPNITNLEIKNAKDLLKAIGKADSDSERSKLIAELQLIKDSLETENKNFKENYIPKSELEGYKAELSRNSFVNEYYNSLGKVLKDGIPVNTVMKEVKEAVSKMKSVFDSTDNKWYVVNDNNERVIETGKARFKELSDVINAVIENDVKWAFQDKPAQTQTPTGGKAPVNGNGKTEMTAEEKYAYVQSFTNKR